MKWSQEVRTCGPSADLPDSLFSVMDRTRDGRNPQPDEEWSEMAVYTKFWTAPCGARPCHSRHRIGAATYLPGTRP